MNFSCCKEKLSNKCFKNPHKPFRFSSILYLHACDRSVFAYLFTDESDRTCISRLRRSPRLRLHQHLLVPAFTLLRDYAARLRDPFDY